VPVAPAAVELLALDAVVSTTAVPEEDSAPIEPPPLRTWAFESFERRPEYPPLEHYSGEAIDEPVLLAPVAPATPADPEPLAPPPPVPIAYEESVGPVPAEIVEAASSDETVEVPASEDLTPETELVASEDSTSRPEPASEELFDQLGSFLADQELEAEFSEPKTAWETFEPVYPSISAQLAALDPPVYKPTAFESRTFLPTAHRPDTAASSTLEPVASDVPSPDELWAQIQSVQPAIAPIEGPELKKRRPPTPPKTPKAPRAKVKTAVPAKPARSPRTKKPAKPMQDEWGLYDPEQCGFAALLERLEDLTGSDATDKKEEGRSAIMRR